MVVRHPDVVGPAPLQTLVVVMTEHLGVLLSNLRVTGQKKEVCVLIGIGLILSKTRKNFRPTGGFF